jgi:hypothetical protein
MLPVQGQPFTYLSFKKFKGDSLNQSLFRSPIDLFSLHVQITVNVSGGSRHPPNSPGARQGRGCGTCSACGFQRGCGTCSACGFQRGCGFEARLGSGLNRLRFLSDWPGSGRRERPEAESVGNASQPTQDWEIKRRSAALAVDLFGRESGVSGE